MEEKPVLSAFFIPLTQSNNIMSLLLTFEIGQHLFRRRHPTPVLLPGKSHGWRSLVGYTVHGIAKSRTRLSDFTFIFSLSCIGEGNGNPLQCSCLENPRDSGAWWGAVYGVAQSRTRLKCLSSSSSSNTYSYTHTHKIVSLPDIWCAILLPSALAFLW